MTLTPIQRRIDSRGRIDIPQSFWDIIRARNNELVYIIDGADRIELRKILPDIPPVKVTGLSATPLSSSQINLTWTKNPENDINHYNIIRNGAPLTFVTWTSTSFVDNNLTPLTSYTYKVVAVDNAGNVGPESDPVTATTLPQSNILFSDAFPTDYTISGGAKSPDNKWLCEYTGGGKVGTRTSSDGRRCFFEYPATSTDQTGGETHASLAKTVQTFTNFEATFQMRTIKQLRVNYPPKNWEVNWFMWSYSNRADLQNRSVNHYYFSIKPHGIEFGKKDNAESDTTLEHQYFFPTVSTMNLTLGQWYTINLKFKDFRTIITVDGVKMVDYLDTPNNPERMAGGSFCFYNEDSEVENANLVIKSY